MERTEAFVARPRPLEIDLTTYDIDYIDLRLEILCKVIISHISELPPSLRNEEVFVHVDSISVSHAGDEVLDRRSGAFLLTNGPVDTVYLIRMIHEVIVQRSYDLLDLVEIGLCPDIRRAVNVPEEE